MRSLRQAEKCDEGKKAIAKLIIQGKEYRFPVKITVFCEAGVLVVYPTGVKACLEVEQLWVRCAK